jgi:PIN domain-containing protein
LKPRSSTNERRPDPTFFVDQNLRGLFVSRLRVAGVRVEELEMHFPAKTPDVEWLPFVGEKGWVAITKDHLRSDPEEQVSLMVHGVKAFVLVGSKATHEEFALLFLGKLRWIYRTIARYDEPFLARLSAKGHTLTTLSDFMDKQARRRR